MVDILLFPPDWMLAELLTITCVIGNPPINPEIIFPAPCAKSSLLVGVTFLFGSSLSVASTQSRVSRLATKAKVNATIQISCWVMTEKFGKLNCPKKEAASSGTGTLTKCDPAMESES